MSSTLVMLRVRMKSVAKHTGVAVMALVYKLSPEVKKPPTQSASTNISHPNLHASMSDSVPQPQPLLTHPHRAPPRNASADAFL